MRPSVLHSEQLNDERMAGPSCDFPTETHAVRNNPKDYN